MLINVLKFTLDFVGFATLLFGIRYVVNCVFEKKVLVFLFCRSDQFNTLSNYVGTFDSYQIYKRLPKHFSKNAACLLKQSSKTSCKSKVAYMF